MATVTQVGPRLGIAPTCAALRLPRATYYRRQRSLCTQPPRRRSPRALGAEEQAAVLAVLHEPRFVDLAPAEVYATLLRARRGLCRASGTIPRRSSPAAGASHGRVDHSTQDPSD